MNWQRISNRGVFKFGKQFAAAQPATEKVLRWLNGQGKVRAYDVQHLRPFFYKGDIMLVYPDKRVKYLELKIESRASTETVNLAIEKYGSIEQQRLGSVWDSQSDFYAHFYRDGLLVWFDRLELKIWMDGHYQDYPTFTAQNEGYSSYGYLVPREAVPCRVERWLY